MALQRQKEECYQASSAARQRVAQEVSGPQFQRQAHRHLHEGHSQAHHDYDVEAAIYAWNNAGMLKEPRVRAMGEDKDMQDPKAIANIEKKKKRHVKDYIEYKLDYQGRKFLVKLERIDFGQEQFYSIIEE